MVNTEVLAVVVTYNRSVMLEKCLRALIAQNVMCDVLVIDNASMDNTAQTVQLYLNEHVHYRCLETNAGGAGGFHVGMKAGVEWGYRYVWVMDDDVIPNADALHELLSAAEKLEGDFGFLSSAVLWKDGRECRMNRQKVRKRFFERIDLLQYGILGIEQATFVSCFIPTKVIRKAGLPIADFFIWGDDIEYTRRLAVRMSLPCYLAGKSIVEHRMTDNTGSDISIESSARLVRYAYAYRNENYLYRQEGIKGMCYYLARCGWHLIRIWIHAKDHRLHRSGILLKAFIAGFSFHPHVEYADEKGNDE